MDRTYETYLLDTLRDVYDFGAARVPYRLLYRWLGIQRATKSTWTRLLAYWDTVRDERGDEEGWQLASIDNGRNDEITLICVASNKQSLVVPIAVRTI